MTRRKLIVLILLVLTLVAWGWWEFEHVTLSALNDPGPLETYLASKAKQWLIARAAREGVLTAPERAPARIESGAMWYGMDCEFCHGKDGREPTAIGLAMYPRAPDLGSASVQRWSDPELFWIIKNGVRMTGMPGFGRSRPDDEIWELVFYVRQLAASAHPPQPANRSE